MASRKRKKRTSRGNFLSRVQRTPKVRSIRSKIKKQKSALKKLSSKYRQAVKSESRRLSR